MTPTKAAIDAVSDCLVQIEYARDDEHAREVFAELRLRVQALGEVLGTVLLLNGGTVILARFIGVNPDGRRVFDDGGPLLVEGLDGEVVSVDVDATRNTDRGTVPTEDL